MLRVGLTGNIASGKSAVARYWRALGAHVVDADELARAAVAPGTPGLRRVAEAFGAGVLDEAGALDRAALRRIVFDDPSARRRLELIVHPEVERLRLEAEARLEREGARIVVHEIPLLFEARLQDRVDVVVLVDAAEHVRRDRLVRRRGLTRQEAQRMIDAQQPPAEKRAASDVVIENDGTLEQLEERAGQVWKELQRRSAAST